MTRPPHGGGGGARRVRCRCGRAVLRQLVGRRAALDVTADADEMTAAAAAGLREPDRLDWCLRTTKAGPDLRWADCHSRGGGCSHPHVIDHQCAAPAAPVPRPRRTVTSSVPEGQLTLD
ncbi:hypothetical protein [Streptomyces alboflavus]|uniref:hypothetical protein n=1 Tax=Streptomyces alboflavus TaxID=67267 RepID=UPI001F0242E5|nr:hypothetical protein [Streptomyces alboflavus]